MTRPGLPVVAALVAACGSSTPTDRGVAVRFSLEESTCGWIPCETPDECPLDCGGEIGVYALDPDTLEEITQICVEFFPQPDDKLRRLTAHLDGSSLSLSDGTRVIVEVAVFAGYQGCPRPFILSSDGTTPDSGGVVGPPEAFPIYWGQSSVHTLAGEDAMVEVELQCTGSAFCPNQTTKITAEVMDLATLTYTTPEVTNTLAVQAANLVHRPMEMSDPWTARMEPFASLQLVSVDPIFEATSDEGFFFGSCGGTLVTKVAAGSTFSTGSCEYYFLGDDVQAQGYYVSKVDLDAILDALSLSQIPNQGLLVGRFTQRGMGTNDYQLRPTHLDSTLTITYLERNDADGSFFVRPQGGSWFVVTDASVFDTTTGLPATCCEGLVAVDVMGDLAACSAGGLGLVEGVVMAAELRIPDVAPLSCP